MNLGVMIKSQTKVRATDTLSAAIGNEIFLFRAET